MEHLRVNTSSMGRPPKSGGFSTVEALVTLGILAILAGLAFPLLGSSVAARERKESPYRVAALISRAQTTAYAEITVVSVRLSM